MGSILEFTLAEEAAAAINTAGVCSHACIGHAPLGLAKSEADDLKRFDPEAFGKLDSYGVTVHDVEIEDFDCIGQLSHISLINQFDSRNDKKLYKHAIAVRLERDLLIANSSPERAVLEAICQVFGNTYSVL